MRLPAASLLYWEPSSDVDRIFIRIGSCFGMVAGYLNKKLS